MSALRGFGILAVSALATLGLGVGSRAPWTPPGSEQGTLRLSWRQRAERVETCRPRTQAELDALPVHMRTPEVCEGRNVAYVLIVEVDDAAPDTMIVTPEGARGDRPVYVFHERTLAPGDHRIRVAFAPLRPHEHDDDHRAEDDDGYRHDDDHDDDEDDDHERGTDAGLVVFSGVIRAAPRAIELITMDEAGRLVQRNGSGGE